MTKSTDEPAFLLSDRNIESIRSAAERLCDREGLAGEERERVFAFAVARSVEAICLSTGKFVEAN